MSVPTHPGQSNPALQPELAQPRPYASTFSENEKRDKTNAMVAGSCSCTTGPRSWTINRTLIHMSNICAKSGLAVLTWENIISRRHRATRRSSAWPSQASTAPNILKQKEDIVLWGPPFLAIPPPKFRDYTVCWALYHEHTKNTGCFGMCCAAPSCRKPLFGANRTFIIALLQCAFAMYSQSYAKHRSV